MDRPDILLGLAIFAALVVGAVLVGKARARKGRGS